MLGRHVQRVEAVPLVFGFGSYDDREAHAREDLFELVAYHRQRMTMAEPRHAAGECDVDAAGRALDELAARLMLRPACFDSLLELVGVAPDALLLAGGRAGNQLHPGGDDAVLAAQVSVADRLRVAGRRSRSELALELSDERRDRFGTGKERHGRWSLVVGDWSLVIGSSVV